MEFEKWVKSIQTAGYDGARTYGIYFAIWHQYRLVYFANIEGKYFEKVPAFFECKM